MKNALVCLAALMFAFAVEAADPLPIVNVSATTTTLSEQPASTSILTFTTDFATPITIHYQFQGTATPNVDYASSTGTITNPDDNQIVIGPNAFRNVITLRAIDDLVYDTNETIVVRILPDPSYIIGPNGVLSLKISDNEFPPTGNFPPIVSMTNSVPYASQHGSWTITAYASDSDGYVARVDLYSETGLVATRTNTFSLQRTFPLTWTNPPVGLHTLYSVATDNRGGVSANSQTVTFVSALDILKPTLQGTIAPTGIVEGTNVNTANGVGVIEWALPDYGTNVQGFVRFFPSLGNNVHHQAYGFTGPQPLSTNLPKMPMTFLDSFLPSFTSKTIDVSTLLSSGTTFGLMLTNDSRSTFGKAFTTFDLLVFPNGFYDIPPHFRWSQSGAIYTIGDPIQLSVTAVDPDTALAEVEIRDEFGVVGKAKPQNPPALGMNVFSATLTNLGLGNHLIFASVPNAGTNFLSDSVAVEIDLPLAPPPEHRFLPLGGASTTCYIVDEAGRAEVWGYNSIGQFGFGFRSANPAYVPQPMTMLPPYGIKWRQIAAGPSFVLGLGNDGSLWGWGNPTRGQFGIETTGIITEPMFIPLPVSAPQTIAAGVTAAYVIDAHSDLWYLANGVCSLLSAGWTDFSVGRDRAVGIRSGDIFDLSSNKGFPPPAGETWAAVSAAWDHTLALTASGQMYAWGDNTYGQLPFGFSPATPTKVSIPGIAAWTKIAAGSFVNLAVDDRGRLFSWGPGDTGALEPVMFRPAPVNVPADAIGWREILTTDNFYAALANDGRVFTWGYLPPFPLAPTQVVGLPNILDPNENRISVAFYGLDAPSIYIQGKMSLAGLPGTIVSLESSPDLLNWTPLQTLTNIAGAQTIQITNTPGNAIFYRINAP